MTEEHQDIHLVERGQGKEKELTDKTIELRLQRVSYAALLR